MNRKLLVPTLAVAAAALLAGCVSGYQYRQGNGDYYYGQPAVQYDDGYGDGYGYGGYGGGWGGSLGFGYGGGGYPYWGYGYPFVYGYPYYDRHHHDHDHGHGHHHHGGHDEPDPVTPPVQPVPPPRIGGIRPPHRPLLPGPMGRTPPLARDPGIPMPRPSTPMPQRQWMPPPTAPRVDQAPRAAPPPRVDDAPRFRPAPRMNTERDGRRTSTR